MTPFRFAGTEKHTVTHTPLRLLDPKQTRDAAEAIAKRGAFFKVAKDQLPTNAHELVRRALFDGIRHLEGEQTYRRACDEGLSRLHAYFPVERVRELKTFAAERLSGHFFTLTTSVGRDFLGLSGEFFVDTNAILRINYPFAQAKHAPRTTDDPSVGSGSSATRTLWQKAVHHPRVVRARAKLAHWMNGDRLGQVGKAWQRSSNYDPAVYHNHLPPAAWAHGPHIDTWYGHAFDGINLWWAIDGVTVDNSMVLYPQSFGKDVQPDPTSMYLNPGTPLPEPASLDLGPGDLLLFNPEILHATHLNIVDVTRIAVTTRINPNVPHFDPRAPFVRTQWLRATDIERGRYDRVKVFPRELHLRMANKQPPPTRAIATFDVVGKLDDTFVRVCNSSQLQTGELARVNIGKSQLLLIRGRDGVNAIGSRCPHLGLDMADGFYDDQRIFCPGHGLVFDFGTGESQCAEFRLPAFDVEERDGSVFVRTKARSGRRAPEQGAKPRPRVGKGRARSDDALDGSGEIVG